jgi:hypothetical protein
MTVMVVARSRAKAGIIAGMLACLLSRDPQRSVLTSASGMT